MRAPSAYNYYFGRMYAYYKVKELPVPEWLKLETKYLNLINEIPKEIYETSSRTNVPKCLWDYIEELKVSPIIKDPHIPDEMYEEAVYTRDLLIRMYDDLLSDKENNLCPKNPCTVTRFGRRIIRNYLDEIRKGNNNWWIKYFRPRKNFLSNMPYGFRFGNTVDGDSKSIDVAVNSSFGLWVSFEVRQKRTHFDFNKEFLDEYLNLKDMDYMEHSDDYTVVDNRNLDETCYVYVYRFDDGEEVIVDLKKNSQSIEIKVLKMLKKYYGQELKNQGINIPWFDVI